jgi:hypothetical protein
MYNFKKNYSNIHSKSCISYLPKMKNTKLSVIDVTERSSGETVYKNAKCFNVAKILNNDDTSSGFEKYGEISIKFENCHFPKGILFNINTQIQHLPKLTISFISCYIQEFKDDGINIISTDLKSEEISINFFNCVISDFELKNCQFKHLYFGNTIFYNSRLLVNSCEINAVQFNNCLGTFFVTESKNLEVNISYSDNNLVHRRNKVFELIMDILAAEGIRKIFEYKTCYYLHNLKKINVWSYKSENQGYKIESVYIKEGVFKKEIKYYLSQKELSLLNITLDIKLKSSVTEKVNIKDAFLNSISISGESDALIDIENIKCNSAYLHEFSSKDARFYNIEAQTKESKFEIKNSDLTNAWFNKVDFKSFELVSFYKTTLERTIFSATKFPSKIEALSNIHYPDKKEDNYFDSQYENYKQLKTALNNQGNQIQALEMHQKMYDAIEKSKNLKSQDKFILFLNRISNKHGTSIKHAFWIILGLIFVFYIAYCLGLSQAPYEFGWKGWNSFYIAISESFVFLLDNLKCMTILANPAHRINDLIDVNNNKSLSTFSYAISFFSRIFIGWGYYQFVSAFRKFGKKL